MNRTEMSKAVRERTAPWDMIIIGGGSTGIGCAVDASTRGFDVLLLEQHDFGKGTSSRSTKLIHGGVRYLKQGNISLVREALRERGILEKNAPHIVKRQTFVIPCYSLFQKIYYGIGLKLYDMLSGQYSFGKSRILSEKETLERLPNIKSDGVTGGVLYYDGQFDDTRLLVDLAQTSAFYGATLLNYARVFGLTKNSDKQIDGVTFECAESGELFRVRAKVVINATGAFCDDIRYLSDKRSEKLVSPSQGIHLVFDRSFLGGEDAIMIPKTSDGRVLFAIPWHDKTLVGTTETPIKTVKLEPNPLEDEVEFILKTCEKYLAFPPKRKDVLSAFAGIRPLVRSSGTKNSAALSRGHTIEIDDSGLLTITGGKWTTYRQMAEDAVNNAIIIADLPKEACVTQSLKINDQRQSGIADLLRENPQLETLLHKDFVYRQADVVHAVRDEMAQTVEDVLSRRTRTLLLDAGAAFEISEKVAEIMANELAKDKKWVDSQIEESKLLAETYQLK